MMQNRHIGKITLFLLVKIMLFCYDAHGSDPTDSLVNMENIAERFERNYASQYREKIYCHINRGDFLTGEDIWFTAWCTNASTQETSLLSKIVYVELIDRKGKPVVQSMFDLNNGCGHGTLYLPSNLQSDWYLLRAYTAWMKNEGPEAFFHQNIRIVNPFKKLNLQPLPMEPAYDLKFFPEGGRLVKGLKSVVTCFSFSKSGNPIKMTAQLVDMADRPIKTIATNSHGMGSFEFTPERSTGYRVRIPDADSSARYFPLPPIEEDGCVLQVVQEGDQITRIVTHTKPESTDPLYMIIHNRQKIERTEMVLPRNGSATMDVEKEALSQGIHHILLIDRQGAVQSRRLIYHHPENPMHLEVAADRSAYPTREQISIEIFSASHGIPLEQTALSVSVYPYHDQWYQPASDIERYMNLESDIKAMEWLPMQNHIVFNDPSAGLLNQILMACTWNGPDWLEMVDQGRKRPLYLPEYRGHLIQGYIKGAITKKPVQNKFVYLSVAGPNPQTYVSRSNRGGWIGYEVNELNGSSQVIMLPEDTIGAYDIHLDDPFAEPEIPQLPPLELDSTLREVIERHSIQMQVQHAYAERESDQYAHKNQFYGEADEVYLLDDYTRFTVMEEVFREYIHGVLVRRHEGKFMLKVIAPQNNSQFHKPPMILLDGIPVFDADKIMAFDPRKIMKIEVVTREFYRGEKTFYGIIHLFTYNGDLAGFVLNPASRIFSYEGVRMGRTVNGPDSSQPLGETEPDYRTQLYWNGKIKTDQSGRAVLEFPASDIPGKYTVEIQALSKNGHRGTKRAHIVVE
jgi:hypothetical protein